MPVSTECAAALLSFRYPSLHSPRKRACKIDFLKSDSRVISTAYDVVCGTSKRCKKSLKFLSAYLLMSGFQQ